MATGIVEQFFSSMTAHDWDGLAACLADEFTRVGPYGDTYASRSEYVAFISGLMPRLAGYAMDVSRVTYIGGLAYAELSETVTIDGAPRRTPECLVFTLSADGRIGRVEVFIQVPEPGAANR